MEAASVGERGAEGSVGCPQGALERRGEDQGDGIVVGKGCGKSGALHDAVVGQGWISLRRIVPRKIVIALCMADKVYYRWHAAKLRNIGRRQSSEATWRK